MEKYYLLVFARTAEMTVEVTQGHKQHC